MATRKRLQDVDKREDKRESILQAARAICAEQGIAALRMDPVAAKAGVAKGTLYLYFSTKDELLRALAEVELQSWAVDLAGQVRAAKDAGSRALGRIVAGAWAGPAALLGPRLMPYVRAEVVEDCTGEAISGAFAAVLPELSSGEALKLWRAICALACGYPAERRGQPEFEEVLANQIRGAVRGQKNKKRER